MSLQCLFINLTYTCFNCLGGRKRANQFHLLRENINNLVLALNINVIMRGYCNVHVGWPIKLIFIQLHCIEMIHRVYMIHLFHFYPLNGSV